MKDQIKDKELFSKIAFALCIMLLLMMFAQMILGVIIKAFMPGILESPWYIGIILGIPLYCIAFPVFLWLMRDIPNGPKGQVEKISYQDFIVMFLISMGATYIFNMLSIAINYFIGLIRKTEIINPLSEMLGSSSLVPIIIFTVIIGPIIEEIIFRGVILDKLRGYGDKRAIFFTAITFALFHGNLSQFFYALALGLIFGYITIKTNTILYSVILHIGVNLFGTTIMPALSLSQTELLNNLAVLVIYFFMITGFYLFVINCKSISLNIKKKVSDIKVSKKLAYLNRGMIFFYILSLFMIVSVILA